jgi:flagellar protein FliO/FliZ
VDKEFIDMLIRIGIYLPFILFLIYIFLKYSGTKLQNIQNGKFIKILERVPISKDNSLMLVKIGNKTHVVTSCINKIEILRDLEADEELKLNEPKAIPEFASLKDFYYKLKRKGR